MAVAMWSAAQALSVSLQSASGSCSGGGCSAPCGLAASAWTQAPAAACVRVTAGQKRNARAAVVVSAESSRGMLGGGRGASVLERPKLDQSGSDNTPMTEEGGESGKSTQRVRTGGGERYRVLLLDHERHTETYVEKALPKAVPNVSSEQARKCFLEARLIGKSVVMVAVKEHAEMYAYSMARFGLRSTIEQDGTTV